MSRMSLMACNGGSLKKGGSPSTISITIIPTDQISAFENKMSKRFEGEYLIIIFKQNESSQIRIHRVILL